MPRSSEPDDETSRATVTRQAVEGLAVFQSYLFSPTFSGEGRWIIHEPVTKRSFLIVGKDGVPSLVEALQAATTAVPDVGVLTSIRSAVPAIFELGAQELAGEDAGMLAFFQRAVWDYPFQDYWDPEWRLKDGELMQSFAEQAPSPPRYSEREGKTIPLPPCTVDFFVGQHAAELNCENLGAILRMTAAAIGEIPGGPIGPWLRKTSPSGGARHPSDVLLLVRDHPELHSGAYFYEPSGRTVVLSESTAFQDVANRLRKGEVAFALTLRCARPMWRYRDPRSFRANFIDAGHVAMTLCLLLEHMGHKPEVTSLIESGDDLVWLDDLPVLLVRFCARGVLRANKRKKLSPPAVAARLVTNPTLRVRFSSGRILAQVEWPEKHEHEISAIGFAALNHAIVSRRKDRDTTRSGLIESVGNLSRGSLEALIRAQLLIEEETAIAFLGRAGAWISHNWYLPLLAYLAGSNQPHSSILSPTSSQAPQFVGADLLAALLKRRTTRAFSEASIPWPEVDSVLGFMESRRMSMPALTARVFVNARRVKGVGPGLYSYAGGALTRQGSSISARSTRALVVGQEPAGAAAIGVWIVVDLLAQDSAYFPALVCLGMLGQVACLRATQLSLGVFTTPAVMDSALCEALGLDPSRGRAAYFLGLGYGN